MRIKSKKIIGLGILLMIIALSGMFHFGILWRSPAYYSVSKIKDFKFPIITMEAYDSLRNHPRPYTYKIQTSKGSVYVLGIDHTRNPEDPQIDTIQNIWEKFNPDIAMVEGRLGFLARGLMDPVENYGESGETMKLAKQNNIPIYTWEIRKEDEIVGMLKRYEPYKIALFYSFRPYFSNYRFGKPENPDKKLKEYIQSRTDFDSIRNLLSVAKVDSIWKTDFKEIKDWRDTSDEYGWPEGYLREIANYSNELRDIHLCSAIIELVNSGHKVFVTMGSSHAYRIEQTLRAGLN